MKYESIRHLVALIVFGCVMLGFACVTSNTNENTTVSGLDMSSVCPTGANLTVKKNNVNAAINSALGKKDYELVNKQRGEKFFYTVTEFGEGENKGLELQLSGILRDQRDKGQPTIEDVLDIVDNLMDKGCIQRVTFKKAGNGPHLLTSDGFEWQACEHPKVYCANGVCQNEAQCGPGMTNANANANANANTNIANTNANRKANAGNN